MMLHITTTTNLRPDLWLERGAVSYDWTLSLFGLEVVLSVPRHSAQ